MGHVFAKRFKCSYYKFINHYISFYCLRVLLIYKFLLFGNNCLSVFCNLKFILLVGNWFVKYENNTIRWNYMYFIFYAL